MDGKHSGTPVSGVPLQLSQCPNPKRDSIPRSSNQRQDFLLGPHGHWTVKNTIYNAYYNDLLPVLNSEASSAQFQYNITGLAGFHAAFSKTRGLSAFQTSTYAALRSILCTL